jgi:hypothetical protein
MEVIVGTTFIRAGPQTRRRLIETVGNYITNIGFLTLIRQIDPQDKRGAQITHICLQLGQFNGNKALWEQVEAWLTAGSGKRISMEDVL